MNLDSQLELQAYLDGELSPRNARRVEAWLAEDQQARLLVAELQNTRAALSSHESETKLPEPRDFYWRKIELEIQRQTETRGEIGASFVFASWRKYLIPVSAAAALVALALVMTKQDTSSPNSASRPVQEVARQIHEFEASADDSRGFTFRDQSAGMTVVWISYADDEGFTDTGLIDTIQ